MDTKEGIQLSKNLNKKFGGSLSNWSIHEVYKGVVFLMGNVHGVDPTGRWATGYTVRTSNIISIQKEKYVETANTVYLLYGKENLHPISDELASKVFF